MEPDYMENLAREYNLNLRSAAGGAEGLIDASIDIVERQLDIIATSLYCNRNSPNSRTLQYLESLKRKTLRQLYALKGSPPIVPNARTRSTWQSGNALQTLINLQIDLFINLDYLKQEGRAVDDIIANETRALGFIGTLN